MAPPPKYYLYDVTGTKLLQLNNRSLPERLDQPDLEVFQGAETVYAVPSGSAWTVVVLVPEPLQHLNENFVTGFSGYSTSLDEVVKILDEHEIRCENTGPSPVSHNDLLEGGPEGIYLRTSGQQVVEAYGQNLGYGTLLDKGWIYEDRGIVLGRDGWVYVTTGGSDRGFFPIQLFPVSAPLLLLKAPKEYLAPEARAAVETQESQEQAAKVWAAVVFGAVAIPILAAVISGMVWQRRRKAATQVKVEGDG